MKTKMKKEEAQVYKNIPAWIGDNKLFRKEATRRDMTIIQLVHEVAAGFATNEKEGGE